MRLQIKECGCPDPPQTNIRIFVITTYLRAVNTTSIGREGRIWCSVILHTTPNVVCLVKVDCALTLHTIRSDLIGFGKGSPGGRTTAIVGVLTLRKSGGNTLTREEEKGEEEEKDEEERGLQKMPPFLRRHVPSTQQGDNTYRKI